MLTIEDIKGIKPQFKAVKVEAWGGEVNIRKLNVRQRDELAEYFGSDDPEHMKKAAIYTVIEGVADPDGKRMFEKSDYDLLIEQDAQAIQFIFEEILKFNGMGMDEDPVKH